MKAISMAMLVAAVGCGGGTSTDLGDGTGVGSTATCTMNFTGAITASGVTCFVIVGYDSSNGRGSIGIVNTAAVANVANFAVAVITSGQPTETTYTIANTLSGSNVAVAANSSTEWLAVGGASAGSFSLALTNMSNSSTSGTQTVWATSHGTFTGTLQPAAGTGATGVVNVSINF
jgi:hypothetical protein